MAEFTANVGDATGFAPPNQLFDLSKSIQGAQAIQTTGTPAGEISRAGRRRLEPGQQLQQGFRRRAAAGLLRRPIRTSHRARRLIRRMWGCCSRRATR